MTSHDKLKALLQFSSFCAISPITEFWLPSGQTSETKPSDPECWAETTAKMPPFLRGTDPTHDLRDRVNFGNCNTSDEDTSDVRKFDWWNGSLIDGTQTRFGSWRLKVRFRRITKMAVIIKTLSSTWYPYLLFRLILQAILHCLTTVLAAKRWPVTKGAFLLFLQNNLHDPLVFVQCRVHKITAPSWFHSRWKGLLPACILLSAQ